MRRPHLVPLGGRSATRRPHLVSLGGRSASAAPPPSLARWPIRCQRSSQRGSVLHRRTSCSRWPIRVRGAPTGHSRAVVHTHADTQPSAGGAPTMRAVLTGGRSAAWLTARYTSHASCHELSSALSLPRSSAQVLPCAAHLARHAYMLRRLHEDKKGMSDTASING